MDTQARGDQDPFRHFFVLTTPVHDPEDQDQYWELQLAATLRHGIKVFPGAPHGYYIVDDARTKGEREILAFFQGDDVMQALEDLRRVQRSELPNSATQLHDVDKPQAVAASSSPGHRHVGVGRRGSQFHGATSHAHVTSSAASRLPSSSSPHLPYFPPSETSADMSSLLRAHISDRDCNTLIPLTQADSEPKVIKNLNDSLYTMQICIQPSDYDHGVTGTVYVLGVDTASGPVWLFGKGFRRVVVKKEDKSDNDAMSRASTSQVAGDSGSDNQESDYEMEDTDAGTEDADTDMDYSDAEVEDIGSETPPGITLEPWDPPISESVKPSVARFLVPGISLAIMHYADSGIALLERYPKGTEIQALVPSWDWTTQRASQAKLSLPRVLAYGANEVLVKQNLHGNIGLALPGYTAPFSRGTPSTFFQAISGTLGPHEMPLNRHVDDPMHMTIRLLHPDVVATHCPDNVRSHLYYGDYWPCAIEDDSGSEDVRVPSFTPKIFVLPTEVLGKGTTLSYGLWAVRMESAALLVPKVPRTNREGPVPCRDSMNDWTVIPITMPTMKYREGLPENPETATGLPVVLDTCSSVSVLPHSVCKAIATQWLGVSPNTSWMACPDELDLDDHEILFTFLGESGNRVTFQCPASRFLKSAWRRQDGCRVPIISQPDDTSPAAWILGQNFFWSAFVRLDYATGRPKSEGAGDGTAASVRLAPQRAKDAQGRYWMDEKSIRIHKLPGRLEAERLRSAGLKYED